jgi:hypothetical protein
MGSLEGALRATVLEYFSLLPLRLPFNPSVCVCMSLSAQFLCFQFKDRLLIGLYCLPSLQEIILSVATANIMGLHDELIA